jgi:hypothetical protein
MASGVLLHRDLMMLRVAIQSLDRTVQRLASAKEMPIHGNGSVPPRRRIVVSPKRRAALVLQGRYMGFMRQLKPRQKVRVKAIKASKGVRAAIAAAKGLRQEV